MLRPGRSQPHRGFHIAHLGHNVVERGGGDVSIAKSENLSPRSTLPERHAFPTSTHRVGLSDSALETRWLGFGQLLEIFSLIGLQNTER